MQKYRNVKTGRVIEVNAKLFGKGWEPVAAVEGKTTAKRATTKKAAAKTAAED